MNCCMYKHRQIAFKVQKIYCKYSFQLDMCTVSGIYFFLLAGSDDEIIIRLCLNSNHYSIVDVWYTQAEV